MMRFSGDYDNPDRLKVITINISLRQLKYVDILVSEGLALSRSGLIRTMLSEWLPQKAREMKEMDEKIKDHELDEEEEEGHVKVPNGDGTFKTHRIMRTA